MRVWPVSRKMAMARLCRLAMTRGLLPVRTWEPGRDRGDLQGAPFGAAVASVPGLVRDGDLPPVKSVRDDDSLGQVDAVQQ